MFGFEGRGRLQVYKEEILFCPCCAVVALSPLRATYVFATTPTSSKLCLFEGLGASSMEISVYTGSTFYMVDCHLLRHYFPQLWHCFDGRNLDLVLLVDQLPAGLFSRSRKSTLSVLKVLFGFFRRSNAWDDEVTEHVTSRFLSNVNHDMQRGVHHIRGLQRSRAAFTTSASLAALTESRQLAVTLVDVFWDQRRDLVDYERTSKLDEWACAIELLTGLVPFHDINKCLQYLARKCNNGLDFGRGRLLQRPEYIPGPRARTMPPVYYRPRISPHPGYLPLPAPEPMYDPLPSPAHSLGYVDAYRDAEIDGLKIEHEILAQKVDQLAWNQAELNAEMGMQIPLPGLRQIQW
jgi:hypothetical protein